jgi:hypothetical protein
MPEIRLGMIAQDMISGFKGVVYGVTEWLNGCKRYCLKPMKLNEGKLIEEQWFDEGDLKIIQNDFRDEPVKSTGGPMNDPKF